MIWFCAWLAFGAAVTTPMALGRLNGGPFPVDTLIPGWFFSALLWPLMLVMMIQDVIERRKIGRP